MVDFQFMSGLNTIGGNIIDIRTDLGRIIFDYGEIPHPEAGKLPDLSQTSENTAIFISHLHIDHIGSFGVIPKEIPIYMSQESHDLYHLLVEIGEEVAIEAEVHPVAYNEPVQIGDITVTLKQSDHDIRGAAAFFVQTPDVKLINSGDVRLSGNHPEYVEKWLEEAQAFKPDVFLLESTAFSFDEEREHVAEADLYEKWTDLLTNQKDNIIFLNTYIRNTDRLVYLSKLAHAKGRAIVLEPKYAYLLEKMECFTEGYVLKNLDVDGQFEDRWISLEAIQKEPGKYVLQNGFNNRQLMEEFDEGVYGHSNGEPLGDYDPRYAELIESVETNHFEFLPVDAGGHASKENLVKMAQAVDAKVTIPWHGFQPEKLLKALAEAGLSSVLPSLDVVYSINQTNK